jgi:crotonobetainyl-CoA:carnitine CoA-transferase CaiB-like acyl-CoA transferase
VYETRDGKFMALAALEPKFFRNFCERAGCLHLADKGMAAGEEGAATIAELDELFATKSQQEWVCLLSQSESCCEPVLQPEEALADPGVNAPRVRVDQATLFGTHFGVAPAVPDEARAPELGEHGRAVMHALGIDTRLVERAIAGGALSPGRELS